MVRLLGWLKEGDSFPDFLAKLRITLVCTAQYP